MTSLSFLFLPSLYSLPLYFIYPAEDEQLHARGTHPLRSAAALRPGPADTERAGSRHAGAEPVQVSQYMGILYV